MATKIQPQLATAGKATPTKPSNPPVSAGVGGDDASHTHLLRRLRAYLSEPDIGKVEHACHFSRQAHAGQRRLTGEPYHHHPLAVAEILSVMQVDAATLCAALLHDVIEDTRTTREELAEAFDPEVADLVDAVTKLTQLDFATRADAQAAYYRKMLLAMSQDLRVILIKLADRLHNMRTLAGLAADKRRRIARETLDIYAPIAARLGMHKFQLELEELCFAAIYPMRFRAIEQALRRARGNRSDMVARIEATINTRLADTDITYRLTSREKNAYSIYQKMRRSGQSFREIHDVYAIRIIVDSVDACYRALGVVHSTFKPAPGKFKDYIAIPKANGYQSLHTTVITAFGVPAEIQIRTTEMDRIANDGIAAHWLYKSNDSSGNTRAHSRAREWLSGLLDMQKQAGNSEEFLDNVKVDLFPSEVYVFTPDGDIKQLPSGATAVDFAYAVHSDIGNHCVAARIDRRLSPLSTRLTSGATVEIITAPKASPSPLWLNFVVTSKARAEIRQVLKNLTRGQAIDLGRRLLTRRLTNLSMALDRVPDERLQETLQSFNAASLDDLLEQIGLGQHLAVVVAQHMALGRGKDGKTKKKGRRWFGGSRRRSKPLAIKGTEGIVVSYARCCRPIPGDPIQGFATAGRGIAIHVVDCPNAAEYRNHPDRWVDVAWDPDAQMQLPVDIRVDLLNQRGALAVIASTIADSESNIENVSIENRDGYHSVANFTIEVRDRVHLARLMRRVKAIREVVRISRKRG